MPVADRSIDLSCSIQRRVVHHGVVTSGHVHPYRIPDGGYLAHVVEQAVGDADKPRRVDRQVGDPVLRRQAMPVQVRVPDQLVGEDAVLEELGNEDEEGGVGGRRLGDEVVVGMQVDAVLAASASHRDGLYQQAKHLAVADGQVDLGAVALVLLLDLDVVVQALHRCVVVKLRTLQ